MLTSLAAVKAWLNITTSDGDSMLTSLINQVSLAILNHIQRPSLSRATYTDLISGVGSKRVILQNWPVISVASVNIDATTVPAVSRLGGVGYSLGSWDSTAAGNPQAISLSNYCFTRGSNNIQIIYQAGYCVVNEAQTVPASTAYTITPTQSYGNWSQDDGVTYANGTALVKVATSPAVGQYSVSSVGVYTFNSADANASVLISYSYVPADLEEACIEWVAERYKYKERIGQKTKSLGGAETASFELKGIPDFIDTLINNYRKPFPF